MPRYIIKIGDKYLEWSTIVDAPVTFGMSLSDFAKHYQNAYGNEGLHGLASRMERVEKFGTSCMDGESIGSFLKVNRAGPNEAPLSIANIRRAYCDRLPIFVWARGNQYQFNPYNGNWEEINRFIVTVNGKYFDWDMNIDKPLTIGLSLDEFNKYYHKTYPPKLVRRLAAHSEALLKTGVSCSLYASWRDVLSFNKTGPEDTALSINQFKKAYCDRLPIIKRVGDKKYQWDADSMQWNQTTSGFGVIRQR